MGFSRRQLSFLLWAFAIHQNCLRMVSCQEEDGSRCLSRKTFFALLRLPEVGSNLAAYSRTARIIQDAKDRTDYANLKTQLSGEDGDEAKICLPPGIYLELFNDPAMRGHLSAIGRAQKMLEVPNFDRAFENSDLTSEDIAEAAKRSIATLAKNGDLPVTIQDRSQRGEDNEDSQGQTTRFDSLSSESLDGLMKILADGGVDDRRNIPEIAAEYTLPNGELDLEALARDYPPTGKRNVAALARDFALPVVQSANSGKRNIASLARDYGLPSGKRNIGTLARDRMLPNGKRTLALLRRIYLFPSLYSNDKRNIGSIANYRSRYGKRFIGALARSGDFPQDYDKRNMASLARNGDLYVYGKRNVGTLARDWSLPNQNRHGRSLTDVELNAERLDRELQKIENSRDDDHVQLPDISGSMKVTGNPGNTRKAMQTSAFEAELTNAKNDMLKNVMGGKRDKRQIDYTDEYPLPVMQNTNVFDYEDMIQALTGEYPNTEKRFMGTGDQMELQDRGGATSGYIDMYQPSKRHIGALARHGWLPSFKAARFSRSPRYPVGREDSTDGTASDYPADSSTWTLDFDRRPITRHLQSLQGGGDCRHGFRRFAFPSLENLGQKNNFAASNVV